MKVQTVYICEKCDAKYKTKEEAEKCEMSHADPVGYKWISYEQPCDTCKDITISKYPRDIHVLFDDGGVVYYKR